MLPVVRVRITCSLIESTKEFDFKVKLCRFLIGAISSTLTVKLPISFQSNSRATWAPLHIISYDVRTEIYDDEHTTRFEMSTIAAFSTLLIEMQRALCCITHTLYTVCLHILSTKEKQSKCRLSHFLTYQNLSSAPQILNDCTAVGGESLAWCKMISVGTMTWLRLTMSEGVWVSRQSPCPPRPAGLKINCKIRKHVERAMALFEQARVYCLETAWRHPSHAASWASRWQSCLGRIPCLASPKRRVSTPKFLKIGVSITHYHYLTWLACGCKGSTKMDGK